MLRLRARLVLPVDAPACEDGVVSIDGGRIVAVERFSGQAGAIDLGECAIVPGLVNAHTHLEFSDLARPLGAPGMSLPEWIRLVIQHRGEQADRGAAISAGITESVRCGVTTIGEIATGFPGGAEAQADSTVFFEVRGLRKNDFAARTASTSEFLNLERGGGAGWRMGLSPHAPYSVHRELLEWTVAAARDRRLPLAMHLAESVEEMELLQAGTGPFRELLESLGVWEESAFLAGGSLGYYLRRLSEGDRVLVIHGNYLSNSDMDFLAKQREPMSVVFCPRTHAYFQHARYPLAELLSRGVNVAIGTDSRASNPDLNLWGEMRELVDRQGASPAEALRMGTLGGAAALGLAGEIGSLSVGKRANLAIVRTERGPSDPVAAIRHRSAVVATMIGGRVVYSCHPDLPVDPVGGGN